MLWTSALNTLFCCRAISWDVTTPPWLAVIHLLELTNCREREQRWAGMDLTGSRELQCDWWLYRCVGNDMQNRRQGALWPAVALYQRDSEWRSSQETSRLAREGSATITFFITLTSAGYVDETWCYRVAVLSLEVRVWLGVGCLAYYHAYT